MQYLLLIYRADSEMNALSADGLVQMANDYGAFTAELKASGHFVACDALARAHTATSVRMRDGKLVTTDGPFAETREQLGGYYLIDAKDRDEAITIAARVPGATYGTIEVRPIQVFDQR